MSNTKRLLYEILAVVVLVGAFSVTLLGTWKCGEHKHGQALEALRAELDEQRTQVEKKAEAELAGRDAWIAALAKDEAEGVFRAFAAGIQPALASGNRDAVDAAVGQFLQAPGVAFIHVLQPDGGVISSSDRKAVSTGSAGPRSAWALQATELTVREGDLAGTTEVASPVPGVAGPVAVIWLGYNTDQLLQSTRPAP